MASAIAKRFGLPAEALAKRLAGGRFRVKSNVPLDTANRFAAELERLGAVVSVVDTSTGQPVRQAPAVKPAPLSFEETLTPPPEAPPTSMPAPSRSPLSSGLAAAGSAATSPSQAAGSPDGFESGLAAAFGGEAQTDMGGAFSGDSASFALATIDGDEDKPPPAIASAPSPGAAPIDEDMFRPPDDGDPIDVALDVAAPPPPSPPPAGGEALLNLFPEGDVPAGSAPIGQPSSQLPVGQGSAMLNLEAAEQAPQGNPVERGLSLLATNLGVRGAVGAVLIVLLGFLPAHLVGMLREGAYDTPREKIAEAHRVYTTTPIATNDELIELDNTVDKARSDQLSIMESTQTSIALTSGVVWLLACGGLGFVWFRKIDWDRWA